MEKKEGGERMEKVEVSDDGGKKPAEEETKPAPATGPVCFKKPAGEDAGILETTKGYLKQLGDTNADTHWDCIKNRVRAAREYISSKTSSAFGRQKVEPEAKEETPVAKPETAPAATESQ